jgi:hypothetical protein
LRAGCVGQDAESGFGLDFGDASGEEPPACRHSFDGSEWVFSGASPLAHEVRIGLDTGVHALAYEVRIGLDTGASDRAHPRGNGESLSAVWRSCNAALKHIRSTERRKNAIVSDRVSVEPFSELFSRASGKSVYMRPQLRGRINRQLKTPDRRKRGPRGDLRHEAIKAHSDFVSPAPQPPPAAIDAAADGPFG